MTNTEETKKDDTPRESWNTVNAQDVASMRVALQNVAIVFNSRKEIIIPLPAKISILRIRRRVELLEYKLRETLLEVSSGTTAEDTNQHQ